SDCQAHLDTVVGPLRRRLDVPCPRLFLRHHRRGPPAPLGISPDRRRDELHRHVLHGLAASRLPPRFAANPSLSPVSPFRRAISRADSGRRRTFGPLAVVFLDVSEETVP